MEKFQEISLGDHGNLRKLPGIQPDDLLDLLINLFFLPLKLLPVREQQADLCRLFDQTDASVCFLPLPDPHIFRVPLHGIFFPAVGEHVFHKGVRIFRGILAAHHIAVSPAAAGFIIKSIGDGVEYGRLSRPCIAGNQEEPAPDFCKINHFHAGIRSERGHGKPDRPHHASPFTSSNTFCRTSCSSPDSSLPCISR